jgi:N-acylneuraminate cytidylyltransferase
MIVAVIPARGGSKRIPRKNIRPFLGRPMISWPIRAARESCLFDHIIVSTDDEQIAGVAREHGAEVPFTRPAALADDFSTTGDVMAHAVEWMRTEQWPVQAVCCLYATAPFVRADDLRAGLEQLREGNRNYVFTATAFEAPIFRAFRQDDNGGVSMFFPEHYQTRSQDLPEAFHDAAQFYWGTPEAWAAKMPLFASHSALLLLPRWRVVDIDTVDDWQRAELMAEQIFQVS